MGKTYITDITHFVDQAGELADMPGPARKLAHFLTLLIDATTQAILIREYDTRIGCRSKGCKGHIHTSLAPLDQDIIWRCYECGYNGVIRNWQQTKWNRQRASGGSAPMGSTHERHKKAVAAALYTPRQGQFLAFIYYYTKIHRCAPAEYDMRAVLRHLPPFSTQHDCDLDEARDH